MLQSLIKILEDKGYNVLKMKNKMPLAKNEDDFNQVAINCGEPNYLVCIDVDSRPDFIRLCDFILDRDILLFNKITRRHTVRGGHFLFKYKDFPQTVFLSENSTPIIESYSKPSRHVIVATNHNTTIDFVKGDFETLDFEESNNLISLLKRFTK